MKQSKATGKPFKTGGDRIISENISLSGNEFNSENNIALFIDHDNIQLSCKEAIDESYDFYVLIDACNKYGRIVLSKVYLNGTRWGPKQHELYRRGFEIVYFPCYKDGNGETRKSLTDPIIICDAIKTLYENPHIDTFIIASGDKDFVPLIRFISQYSVPKRIIVIAVNKCTSKLVIDECSRLPHAIFLDYIILHRNNVLDTSN